MVRTQPAICFSPFVPLGAALRGCVPSAQHAVGAQQRWWIRRHAASTRTPQLPRQAGNRRAGLGAGERCSLPHRPLCRPRVPRCRVTAWQGVGGGGVLGGGVQCSAHRSLSSSLRLPGRQVFSEAQRGFAPCSGPRSGDRRWPGRLSHGAGIRPTAKVPGASFQPEAASRAPRAAGPVLVGGVSGGGRGPPPLGRVRLPCPHT